MERSRDSTASAAPLSPGMRERALSRRQSHRAQGDPDSIIRTTSHHVPPTTAASIHRDGDTVVREGRRRTVLPPKFSFPSRVNRSIDTVGGTFPSKKRKFDNIDPSDPAHQPVQRGELRRNAPHYGVSISTSVTRSDGRQRTVTRLRPASGTVNQRRLFRKPIFDVDANGQIFPIGGLPPSMMPPASRQSTTFQDVDWVEYGGDDVEVDDWDAGPAASTRSRPLDPHRAAATALTLARLLEGSIVANANTEVAESQPKEKTKRVRSTAGDDPMADWRLRLDKIQNRLMMLEWGSQFSAAVKRCEVCEGLHAKTKASSDPPLHPTPSSGGCNDTRLYRCVDCLGGQLLCRPCMKERHLLNPFHHMQILNTEMGVTCFEPIAPAELGITIELGHHGAGCGEADSRSMTIMDISGVYNMTVNFCHCRAGIDDLQQLLDARLFPATCLKPRTVFTFRCLEMFDLLSMESKITAYEFCATLARLTDNVVPSDVDSRYSQFLNVSRLWAYWKDIKHAGASYPDWNGDLALLCPACPHEGINLPPDWLTAPDDQRYLYFQFAAFDGNMKLRRNLKMGEKFDPALRKGRAYFVESNLYMDWLHEWGGSDLFTESPTCSGFRQQALANTRGKTGVAVTGVGGGMCSRHEMILPRSVVDFQKGERYCNMDYAIGSGLQSVQPIRLVDPDAFHVTLEGGLVAKAPVDVAASNALPPAVPAIITPPCLPWMSGMPSTSMTPVSLPLAVTNYAVSVAQSRPLANDPGEPPSSSPSNALATTTADHATPTPRTSPQCEHYALDFIRHFNTKIGTHLWPSSSIAVPRLRTVVLSYDVVCQWNVHAQRRMLTLPTELQYAAVTVVHAVPKAHLPMHQVACHGKYSLNFIFGAGRTDGEGIERGWTDSNASAKSTIEMKPGSRLDTLDHRWTYYNYKKRTGLGDLLRQRHLIAIEAKRIIRDELAMFEDKLPADQVSLWQEDMRLWEKGDLPDSPFVSRKAPCPTQAERALASEQQDQLGEGPDNEELSSVTEGSSDRRSTPVKFIVAAVAIEGLQRQILSQASTPDPTTAQQSALLHARKALKAKISDWRRHQAVHMAPGLFRVEAKLEALREDCDTNDTDLQPEDTPLLLPSSLGSSFCTENQLQKLARIEIDIRLGAATDSLHKLRGAFRYKSAILKFQREGFRSQVANTRARVRLAAADGRIAVQVAAYRCHQRALIELGISATIARELRSSDLKALSEWVFGDRLQTGQKHRHIPWIWLRDGIAEEVDDDEAAMDDMRVEYMKTLASAHRWSEECLLLSEEMRRALLTLEYEEAVWLGRMLVSQGGLQSYALRQARQRRRLRSHFASLWNLFDSSERTQAAVKALRGRKPQENLAETGDYSTSATARRAVVSLANTVMDGDSSLDEGDDVGIEDEVDIAQVD